MSRCYRVDPLHSGIRLASFLALGIGGLLGLFVIMPAILSLLPGLADWRLCLSLIGAAALGVISAWAAERVLLPIWPSGRTLGTNQAGVAIHEQEEEDVNIRWDQPIDVLAWYFVIRKRRGPVPRGWYCLACQLKQGDSWITGYCFIKPDIASKMPMWRAFEELVPPSRSSLLGQSPQAFTPSEDLRAAEYIRWQEGCELAPEDFVELVETIAERVPNWP